MTSDFQARIAEIDSNNTDHSNKQYSGTVDVPTSLLIPDVVGLRDKVDKKSEKYQQLVQDIKRNGILNSINFRRAGGRYIVIDGLHRLTAAQEAGLPMVPGNFFPNVVSDDVLYMQVSANLHKIDTKPAQYSAQLGRILAMNPLMTISDLARRLNVSSSWVQDRLRLDRNLRDEYKTMADEGEITASNAFVLAKLPPEEQENYIERAQTLSPADFTPLVAMELQNISRNKRGTKAESSPDLPPFVLRRKPIIESAWVEVAERLQKMGFAEEDYKAVDKDDAAYLVGYYDALRFVGGRDDESIEAFRQEKAEREAERERKRRDEERKKTAEKAMASGNNPFFKTVTPLNDDNVEEYVEEHNTETVEG